MTISARPCRTSQAGPSRATEDGVVRHRPNRGAYPSPRAAHSTCTSPLWRPQTSPPSTPPARPEQVQERTIRRCRWQADSVALLKRSRSRAFLLGSCPRVFLSFNPHTKAPFHEIALRGARSGHFRQHCSASSFRCASDPIVGSLAAGLRTRLAANPIPNHAAEILAATHSGCQDR